MLEAPQLVLQTVDDVVAAQAEVKDAKDELVKIRKACRSLIRAQRKGRDLTPYRLKLSAQLSSAEARYSKAHGRLRNIYRREYREVLRRAA